jgi:CDP-diacylglycerol--serine O-phosphatidyltransferase
VKKKQVPLYKLFPSIITIIALCMGLTAIKYTFEGNFEMAVIMVLIACVMDGIDGPSARLLKSSSNFGAQLDSLCDLVNFGVAPGIIIYNWKLCQLGVFGWCIILVYVSCTALRLARYNVESLSQVVVSKFKDNSYFHGISSPCGGILVLSPLIATFQLLKEEIFHLNILGFFVLFIALMMVSRIPTVSTKGLSIKKRDIPFIMALFAIVVALIFFMPWKIIPILSIIYLLSIPCTFYYYKRKTPSKNIDDAVK